MLLGWLVFLFACLLACLLTLCQSSGSYLVRPSEKGKITTRIVCDLRLFRSSRNTGVSAGRGAGVGTWEKNGVSSVVRKVAVEVPLNMTRIPILNRSFWYSYFRNVSFNCL